MRIFMIRLIMIRLFMIRLFMIRLFMIRISMISRLEHSDEGRSSGWKARERVSGSMTCMEGMDVIAIYESP